MAGAAQGDSWCRNMCVCPARVCLRGQVIEVVGCAAVVNYTAPANVATEVCVCVMHVVF